MEGAGGWRGTNTNIRIQREREGNGIGGQGEGGRKKLAAGAKKNWRLQRGYYIKKQIIIENSPQAKKILAPATDCL